MAHRSIPHGREDAWKRTSGQWLFCLSGWFLFVALCGWAGVSWAATSPLTWFWSNPDPFGANVVDLAWHAELGYVVVGDRGQLFTSIDKSKWVARETGTQRGLRSATFFGRRLVVTGESGTVLWGDDPAQMTLISLGTEDWLEGVAAATNAVVAVGDHGAIFRSADGVAWERQASGTTDWLRGVAWGGGLFACVGESGRILTSTNGSAWVIRQSPVTKALNRVAWTGRDFIAVGDGGNAVIGSADGRQWSLSRTGITNDLWAVAVDQFSAPLIAGDQAVLLRVGNNWIDELNPSRPFRPASASYLSAMWDGVEIVLGGRTGLLERGRRPSETSFGYNWTNQFQSSRSWIWDLADESITTTNVAPVWGSGAVEYRAEVVTNRFYVGVGDSGTILQSTTGVDWLPSEVPDTVKTSEALLLGVAARPESMMAVGAGGVLLWSPSRYAPLLTQLTVTNSINAQLKTNLVVTNWVNAMGEQWFDVSGVVRTNLQGVAGNGSLWVAAGAGGVIVTSPTGQTWTRRSTPTSAYLSSVEAFPDGFVAVGDQGTVLKSGDGVNWSTKVSGTSDWIYRVRWLGGQLLAVGEGGGVWTSSTGEDWVRHETGVTNWLNDVDFVDGEYFVVGNQGTVLRSSDRGARWLSVGAITGKSLYALASNAEGQLVAAGVEGVILRSPTRTLAMAPSFLSYERRLNSGAAAENLFVIQAKLDQRVRLDHAGDLENWQVGDIFDVTDPDGVLILSEPDAAVEPEIRQFFRAVAVPR